MVTITNTVGLPEPVANAVRAMSADYDRGDCDASVTELVTPTRIAVLRRRHDHEIVREAVDSLFLLRGWAMHEIMRKSAEADALVEERIHGTLPCGMKVSGKFDHYRDGVITDWKDTSVWSILRATKEGAKDEYVWQLNGYRWLLETVRGLPVHRLQNVLFGRDWMEGRSLRSEDYPAHGAVMLDIGAPWPLDETIEWLNKRALAFWGALKIEDEAALPPCSDRERWKRPDVWAAVKASAKPSAATGYRRAFPNGVFLDESKAAAKVAATPGAIVEHRPGLDVRCASYCEVWQWCDHGRAVRAALDAVSKPVPDLEPEPQGV